jgi:hypothetical protein
VAQRRRGDDGDAADERRVPFWSDLRRELHEQGVDPDHALLVESYDEPPAGDQLDTLVTDTGRLLAYRAPRPRASGRGRT